MKFLAIVWHLRSNTTSLARDLYMNHGTRLDAFWNNNFQNFHVTSHKLRRGVVTLI